MSHSVRTYRAKCNKFFFFSIKENKLSLKQALLITGTVAYATFAGVRLSLFSTFFGDILQNNLFKSSKPMLFFFFKALPQIIIQRSGVRSISAQVFCRSVLPVPLSGR